MLFIFYWSALEFNSWLAATGAIAFTFCSYNFISIEAGHTSKVIAISYLSPIIAGVILAFRGKYWLGGALTAFFWPCNYMETTFRLPFICLFPWPYTDYSSWCMPSGKKNSNTLPLLRLALAVAVLLSVGSHASRLLTTYEYSKETIRGKSELTKTQNTQASGLDKEYAFQWSYGKSETFTLLIPDFYGGASRGELSTSSEYL